MTSQKSNTRLGPMDLDNVIILPSLLNHTGLDWPEEADLKHAAITKMGMREDRAAEIAAFGDRYLRNLRNNIEGQLAAAKSAVEMMMRSQAQ